MEIVFRFSDFFAHLLWCANIYHNDVSVKSKFCHSLM